MAEERGRIGIEPKVDGTRQRNTDAGIFDWRLEATSGLRLQGSARRDELFRGSVCCRVTDRQAGAQSSMLLASQWDKASAPFNENETKTEQPVFSGRDVFRL